MRKKTTQTVSVLFFALTVCFLMPMNARSAPDKNFSAVLKAGGGAVGGIGYMVLTGMSKTVREVYPRMDITVVPGGWVGNLFRVDKGELDIGSTTTAMCSLAESQKAPFDKPLPNIRALYSTQDKLYYFAIVTKETPVNSTGELFEKKPPIRLCTLQKGTTTELMWSNLFQSQGLTWDDVSAWGGKINHVAWGDAVNLVKDGHADGILAVGVRQLGWAMDLTNARDMKILQWDEDMFKLLSEKFGFGTDTIPGGTYPGIDEDVMCPTDSGEIIVNKNISDDVVTAILTALADNAESHSKHHKALANFKAEGMAKTLKLPLHEAAVEFYKSRGIEMP